MYIYIYICRQKGQRVHVVLWVLSLRNEERHGNSRVESVTPQEQ